jgi:hypothetical protein
MTTPMLPVFYKNPRPLLASSDAGLSLAAVSDYGFAAGANSVPVVATEMPLVCKYFPILFTQGELPQPVALLGLRNAENLFVDGDGKWADGIYIPAYVRRYPFIFLENRHKDELTLCIDEGAPSIVAGRDNPFFTDEKPTTLTNNALSFCTDYQAHYNFTTEFAKALADTDLLIENRADVTLNTGAKLSLAGFKIIDEARFNSLPNKEFAKWRERGWLSLVYCHFISTGNWSALADRLAARSGNA